MAVTSAPAQPNRRNFKNSVRGSGTVATGVTSLLQHTLCVRKKNGLLKKPADETTTMFMGQVIGRNFAAGEVATFAYNYDVQIPLATAVVQSMVGVVMYAVDNYAATSANTLGPQIGPLTELTSANLGYVWLRGPSLSRAS